MPDDRFIHPRLGHSKKVGELSYFERAVWQTYLIAADDFGVMRFSAVTIRDADDKIACEPERKVQAALTRLATIGLVRTFDHQGRAYCYQHDWQNWQRVRHPRVTINPMPPADAIAGCTPTTQKLFGQHSSLKRDDDGETAEEHPQDLGKVAEIPQQDSGEVGSLACARARETANGLRLTAEGQRPTAGGEIANARPATLVGRRNLRRMNEAGVVPLIDTQFAEFVSRVSPKYPDRDSAYDAVSAWMHRVDDEVRVGGKSQTGNPFDWWRDRFDRDWSEASAPAITRASDWQAECAELHNHDCGSRGIHEQRVYLERAKQGAQA